MKTVLILTSGKSQQGIDSRERFGYVQAFCDAVEDKLSDTRVLYTTYDDIETSVVDGVVSMFDSRNKLDLSGVDFVHFKNWINDTQTSGMLARFFTERKIAMYNSEVVNAPARTKISQMVLLATSRLPVPDTFFSSKERLAKFFSSEKSLPGGLKMPFIMKANDGAKGNDNYLIKDLASAREIIKNSDDATEFVLQEFHPNDGDYRVLFVGLEESPLVFLRRAKKGSNTHLNNTSQGGEGEFVDISKLPKQWMDIALKAAKVTGREIGGVDILVDKDTKEPYILEVNQTPALATGFGVEEKVARFANLVDSLDVESEE